MSGFVVTARLAIKFGVVLALITTVWLPVSHVQAEVESDELEAFDLRGRQIELLYKSYTEILQTACLASINLSGLASIMMAG